MEYLDYNLTIADNLKTKSVFNNITTEEELKLEPENRTYVEDAIRKMEEEPNSIEEKTKKQLVQIIGTKLADAIFTPEIKKHFHQAKGQARDEGKGIRIRLRIESPELANYPWESLYLDGKFLSTSIETPITYRLDDIITPRKTLAKPLKILFIGSSPTSAGLSGVDIENEIKALESALEEEIKKGIIKITVERTATAPNIINHLTKNDYNIVHFIGHGLFEDGVGKLALVREDNNDVDPADHERIGQIFQNGQSLERSLGLIILNACQGAKVGSELSKSTAKAFTGLAPELIKMGFPSIIAMRYSITNQMAHFFTREFYRDLLRMPIDEKIQRVRQNILVNNDAEPFDFAAPVLFMSSPDGLLFSPTQQEVHALTDRLPLKQKIEELKEAFSKNQKHKIDDIDFLLDIANFRNHYRKELPEQSLVKIQKIVVNVQTSIRYREEADLAGDNGTVLQHARTIVLNFNKFMDILSDLSDSQ